VKCWIVLAPLDSRDSEYVLGEPAINNEPSSFKLNSLYFYML